MMPRLIASCLLFLLLLAPAVGQENDDQVKQRFEQLLKDRPELKRMIDAGEIDREQIMNRLKMSQGDATQRETPQRDMQRRRPTRRRPQVDVKDPDDFTQAADGKALFSGPQPGEKVGKFKATGIGRVKDGEPIDALTAAAGKPQMIIFQDNNGAGVRGLLGFSGVLGKLKEKSGKSLHTTVVFLDDDTTAIRQFVGRFADRLGGQVDLVATSDDGRDGPGNYGLNRNISQTILLVKDGRVTRNFVFPQGLLYSDPYVMGGIAELLELDRDQVAKWANEETPESSGAGRMDSQRPTNETNPAAATLRTKLMKFVQEGKLTREEAIDLYQTAFPNSNMRSGADRSPR